MLNPFLLFLPWVLVIILFSVPVIVLLAILKAIFGGSREEKKSLSQEETRMMQEVFQGFERMEKRIEALETILLDEHKPTERKPDHEK